VLCSHEARFIGRHWLRLMHAPLSASLGLAEAWLITLIALVSIAVGSALLYWQHRAAGRALRALGTGAGDHADVALELDSEA
jgi:protein-S-isoprenylcysteine O-methyltransferase Ste14